MRSVVHRKVIRGISTSESGYTRVIEDWIAKSKGNRLNFSEIYRLVRDRVYSKVSKTTIHRHLRVLKEQEIINKDDAPRARNEVYYSVTPARLFERQIFDLETKTEPRSHEEIDDDVDKKACLLMLLQAALGTESLKVVNEPVLGGVHLYNPATQRYECFVGSRDFGVTMQDIIEHRDIGHGGLFKHVNFTSSTKNCIERLRHDFGLHDTLRPVDRGNIGDRRGEISIQITDKQLSEFIAMCGSMISEVWFRMSDTINIAIMNAFYQKGSLKEPLFSACSFSMFEQETLKWYLSLYGRRALNHKYNRCKKEFTEFIRDIEQSNDDNNKPISKSAIKKEMRYFIQKRRDRIEQWDKSIIAFYHGLIKCDRYVDAPGGLRDRYDKYCDYVRTGMPEKYCFLRDSLMRMVYPTFLRRYHHRNPTLVEFTKSLRQILGPFCVRHLS